MVTFISLTCPCLDPLVTSSSLHLFRSRWLAFVFTQPHPSGFAAAPRANICIDLKTRGWIQLLLRQPRAFNAFARNPMFSSFPRKWEFSHFLAISCRKVERKHLHSRGLLVWKSKLPRERHLEECCPSFCSSFNFLTRLMVLQQLQNLWWRIR